MAVVLMFENPSVSKEQYDQVRERVDDGQPVEGRLVHIAGEGPNGAWRVIEVWESQEAAQKFAAEKLQPIFEEVGIERPPPQAWQVHRLDKR